MKLLLGYVSGRRGKAKSGAAEALAEDYVERAGRLGMMEMAGFSTEAALLEAAEKAPGRAAAVLVLFDGGGERMSSEEYAKMLGRLRDEGAGRVMLGVGPADGWSEGARGKAWKRVSLGGMTLPHELARVMVAEQTYRALTILAGHPYHCGH